MRIDNLPRTTTRTTYYALHHTLRLLAWQNRQPLGEALSDFAIYGRALIKIGAEGMLQHVPLPGPQTEFWRSAETFTFPVGS